MASQPTNIPTLQNHPPPNPPPPATDPEVYRAHHDAFAAEGLPTTPAGWIERARKVAAILAPDAAARNREQKTPRAEVALLKSSGLTKILGDKKYGGGGESWDTALKCIREVAVGDGSIGMILGYHLTWSTTARVLGTEEQRERYEKLIIENNYFCGAAVNPRDNDSRVSPSGDGLVFNGFKNFTTGAALSDLVVLEGVLEGTEHHVFAIVKTDQPGFIFSYNWNAMGMRLTESGSTRINNVPIAWEDCLGWDLASKVPNKAIHDVPFSSILAPTIQAIFSNFYLGIAYGALQTAKGYTLTQTRAWPFTFNPQQKATDEHYIVAKYGRYYAQLQAVEALADRIGPQLAAAFRAGRDLTETQRGEIAEAITALKIMVTHTALEVTAGVFEVTGARSTSEKYGFDRFWKDIRTHSLHDPVAYKESELGRYYLLGEYPKPSWYQ